MAWTNYGLGSGVKTRQPKAPPPQLLRVFVCSKLRAGPGGVPSIADNIARAKRLCIVAVRAGAAPFAPHVFYPSLGLDDTRREEREMGMAAARRWLAVSDEIWVDAKDESECSQGMLSEVELARKMDFPIKIVFAPECWVKVR